MAQINNCSFKFSPQAHSTPPPTKHIKLLINYTSQELVLAKLRRVKDRSGFVTQRVAHVISPDLMLNTVVNERSGEQLVEMWRLSSAG